METQEGPEDGQVQVETVNDHAHNPEEYGHHDCGGDSLENRRTSCRSTVTRSADPGSCRPGCGSTLACREDLEAIDEGGVEPVRPGSQQREDEGKVECQDAAMSAGSEQDVSGTSIRSGSMPDLRPPRPPVNLFPKYQNRHCAQEEQLSRDARSPSMSTRDECE
jgi:hypothetical protein